MDWIFGPISSHRSRLLQTSSAQCTQQIFSPSCTSFQQSRHVMTRRVAWSLNAWTSNWSLLLPHLVKVSLLAPWTGHVTCRVRPNCAKSGHARQLRRLQLVSAQSTHSNELQSSVQMLFEVPPKNLSFTNHFVLISNILRCTITITTYSISTCHVSPLRHWESLHTATTKMGWACHKVNYQKWSNIHGSQCGRKRKLSV